MTSPEASFQDAAPRQVRSAAGSAADPRVSPAVVFALHGVMFLALAWWSWLKWPDPLIDFGRELYLPWQITRGKVLYRDIESLFGPLSPYVNALWFRLFGVSLLTLVAVNLVVLAATLAGVHRLVRLSTDRFTATVASLLALTLFGFLQLAGVGNYNFVTPYSHEATHGIALAIGVLLALQAAVAGRRALLGAVAGLAFGLLVLTKPETSVAAAAAAAVTLLAAAAMGAPERRLLRAVVPLFVVAAAVPSLLFFAYLRQHMDAVSAVGGLARGWTAALDASITTTVFYVRGMGLDRPASNALRMLLAFGAFLIYIAAMGAVCRTSPAWSPGPTVRTIGRLLLLAFAPAAIVLGLPRALPLLVLAAAAVAAVLFVRARHEREPAVRLLALLTWCTFALVLLAKLGLNARIHHYGFYLAMPAATVVAIVMCWLVPRLLERTDSPGAARQFRRLAAMAVAAAVAPYLGVSHAMYRTKTVPVGSGGDRFLASDAHGYWQGAAARDVLEALKSVRRPGDTLAVLPEGVMLNYLARLDSPLRVVTLMPPELHAFGEDAVLGALRAAPPRFVLLVHKDTSEYGYPPFGTDPRYGQRTIAWIASRYRSIGTFGAGGAPSAPGMELFERN